MERRNDLTCADPSLADVYVAGYSPANSAHTVSPRWVLALQRSGLGADWEIQGDLFLAWQTEQEFTVPFYRLFNPTTTDWITMISTDGSPPVVSGFEDATVIGFAYSTQVCGSVPLLGASLPSKGDHWYTTDVREHNFFLENGWVDAGIAAFVLPLNEPAQDQQDSWAAIDTLGPRIIQFNVVRDSESRGNDTGVCELCQVLPPLWYANGTYPYLQGSLPHHDGATLTVDQLKPMPVEVSPRLL
ncbi:hypothetical protein JR316_0013403 [Psilocybe cubensis]|uniref:Uncharacterized protein n=2 Tax=Psilocybe cubensis TaxID=181762 RepID=A0ACB8GFP7_PSICU|nr:uncharacterized protein JR316_0013403 [Psilocybe cubensis]KAH9474240.1 hypothetical protein JR316_0013403 [Psilocybe cubensis]